MSGTSIRVFLPDGSPDSVRLVSKSHWTGIALAVPRARYTEARVSRREFQRPGVYVLLGPSEGSADSTKIYVGEGDDARARLDHHHANKDFWTSLVLFTSANEALNKATTRYLEARLIQLAQDAGRVELSNGVSPALPPLSEADIEDAESFLRDMLVIYPIVGVTAFEPQDAITAPAFLHLQGADARGEGTETDDGFLVRAGALARIATVPSTPAAALATRQNLVDAGKLVPAGDGTSLRLVRDHLFPSPTAAATALLGRNAAGPLEWKDESGTTLRQLREESVSAPGLDAPAAGSVVAS